MTLDVTCESSFVTGVRSPSTMNFCKTNRPQLTVATMIEVTAFLARIKDLKERVDVLRRYL